MVTSNGISIKIKRTITKHGVRAWPGAMKKFNHDYKYNNGDNNQRGVQSLSRQSGFVIDVDKAG